MSAAFVVLLASLAAGEPSLILHGGKVFLGPGRRAAAVAVEGNRFSAVGSDEEILALRGPETRVVDLKGRALVPGFHDAHQHLVRGGLSLDRVELRGTRTIKEVQERVRDFARRSPGSGWIIGSGWERAALGEPDRLALDAAVSTRPVALSSEDGSAIWLNTEALRVAGIGPRSPNLVKGRSLRDTKGSPSGLFLDAATSLATRAIPAPTRAEKLAAARVALRLARESGVTSITTMPDPGAGAPEELEIWRELQAKGEFTARLFLYGPISDPAGFAKLRRAAAEFPPTKLRLVGVKGFIDGTILARTAALLEPYFDEPRAKPPLKLAGAALKAAVRDAHRAGHQVALHASGDQAVKAALEACEASVARAAREVLVLPRHPCRIEHAELIDPADLARFKPLRAAVSVQPGTLSARDEIANRFPERVGERVRRLFALRSLAAAGALTLFGSDWPAGRLHPRYALFAATTRRHLDGKPETGWVAEQKISLESALRAHTWAPAEAVGLSEQLGEIRPGALADLVVLDRDLFGAAPLELLELQVDMTVFDGQVVFERK